MEVQVFLAADNILLIIYFIGQFFIHYKEMRLELPRVAPTHREVRRARTRAASDPRRAGGAEQDVRSRRLQVFLAADNTLLIIYFIG